MIRRTRFFAVFIAAVLMTTVLQPAGTAESKSGTPVFEAWSTQSQEAVGQADVGIGDRYVDLTDRVGNRIRIDVPATKLPGQDEPTSVTRFDSGTFSLAISRIADGASALIEIPGPDAPTEHIFDFEMPNGWSLVERVNSSLTFVDSDGDITGTIAPPWAVDADGNEVETSFALRTRTHLYRRSSMKGPLTPSWPTQASRWAATSTSEPGATRFTGGELSRRCTSQHGYASTPGGTLWLIATAAALKIAFNTNFGGDQCQYVVAWRYWLWPNYMERLNRYGCSYYKTEIPG